MKWSLKLSKLKWKFQKNKLYNIAIFNSFENSFLNFFIKTIPCPYESYKQNRVIISPLFKEKSQWVNPHGYSII